METFVSQRFLPSCRVGRGLVVQLEKYLHLRIPRLLQKELSGMRELFGLKQTEDLKRYNLTIETKGETTKLSTIGDLSAGYFPPATRRLSLDLRIGRPEILHLSLVFPHRGRPLLKLATVSQTVKKHAPDILDGLTAIVAIAANRNGFWNHRLVQAMVALAVPAAMVGYGHLAGGDPFFLCASSGWLVLLGAMLGLTLPALFPRVSYQTGRRFSLRKASVLLLLALNIAAIGGYAWLLAFHLQLLTS